LKRWKNYFYLLLNVCGAGGVWQTEMHTAEPFVPEPSASDVEAVIGKLKMTNPQVLIRFQLKYFRQAANIAFGDT
jgi:hypothetical protein